MAIKYVVDEIRRLSQDEGKLDSEVAEAIGCSRATVNRNRGIYNIPKANLRNRQDKVYVCLNCHKDIIIRRKDVMKLYCDECEKKIESEDIEK